MEKKKPKGPKANVYVRSEWCKGCGFCVEFCKPNVLVLSDDFNQKGYHPPEVANPEKCTNCKLCDMFCPEFCIWTVKIEKEEEDN